MTETLLASIASITGLFMLAGSLGAMYLGRRLGQRWLEGGSAQLNQLDAVDAGVFALLGLLLAFALAGAIGRFDTRREAIVREANAISKAYRSFDLLPAQARSHAQEKLRQYTKARIDLYAMKRTAHWQTLSVAYSTEQQQKIHDLEQALWTSVVGACQQTTTEVACSNVLPAIGEAIEISKFRAAKTEMHPPLLLTSMLVIFGIVGSLLVGFRMHGRVSLVHSVIFALAMAATVFMTLEIEYPRLGYITIDDFDRFLIQAHDQMK